MELWLNEDQARELDTALDVHLDRLEQEISRTEDRGFRYELRQTINRLEEVRHQLRSRLLQAGAHA